MFPQNQPTKLRAAYKVRGLNGNQILSLVIYTGLTGVTEGQAELTHFYCHTFIRLQDKTDIINAWERSEDPQEI